MFKNQIIFLALFSIYLLLAPHTFAVQTSEETHYEKALNSYNEQDIEAAYIFLKNTLKENDEHIPGKILMGKVLLENGHYPDAAVELSEALSLGGDIEFIIKPLGEALYYSKRYQEVLLLDKNLRLSKTAKIAQLLVKAKTYAKLKQPDEEWQQYRMAYRLGPSNQAVLNQLATYHINKKEFDQAKVLIERLFSLNKANYFTWNLLGQLQKSTGQLSKAITSFEQVLMLKSDNINAKRALASIFIERRDINKATNLIDEVLEASPNDFRAKLLKANLLLDSNENAQAKTILNTLNQQLSLVESEVLAENDWIYFINGISAFLLENYELSVKELNKYLAKQPDNFYAISLLSQGYLKLNQRSYAREILEEHIDMIPQDKNLAITLCDLLLERNKSFKCEELIAKLTKLYPDDVDVTLAQARLLLHQTKNVEAINLLVQSNKQNRDIKYEDYLITLYLNSGQPGKAAFIANKLLNEFPNNLELMNSIAAALISMEMYPHAYKVTLDILAQNNNYFPAKYNQASALLKLKRPEMAQKTLHRMIEVQPKSIKSWLLLAEVNVALGKSKNAIYALNEVLKIDQNNTAAQEFLAMLLKLSGQYEQALILINNLLTKDRLSANYIKTKIELLFAMREYQQLKKQFNILFSLSSENTLQLLELSKLQRKARDMFGARQTMNRALKLSPKSEAVLYADAKLSVYEQKGATAEEKLANLKKKLPNNSEVSALEGDSLLSRKKPEQAQSAYLRAFSLNKKNGMALVKAYKLANRGFKPKEFESALLISLQEFPNNHYYRNLLADYYLLGKRHAEAQHQYELIKNTKSLPNKAEILNNLAIATMDNDLSKAQVYAAQASQLSPASASILDTYGWILAKQNAFSKALSTLRQARSLDANDPSIGYHLGYVLLQLGRNKEAYEELTVAVQSKQEFDGKADATIILEQIDL